MPIATKIPKTIAQPIPDRGGMGIIGATSARMVANCISIGIFILQFSLAFEKKSTTQAKQLATRHKQYQMYQ